MASEAAASITPIEILVPAQEVESTSPAAPSTLAIASEHPPLAIQYWCVICKDSPIDFLKSNPAKGKYAKDPSARIEVCCATNRRNQERRVRDRKASNPSAPIIAWWSKTLANEKDLAKWAMRMKARKAFESMTDDQIMQTTSSVRSKGIVENDGREYIGFDTIQWENPELELDKQLLLWHAKVKQADHTIEKDGQVFIPKPRTIQLFKHTSNMVESRHDRHTTVNDRESLTRACNEGAAKLRDMDVMVSHLLGKAEIPHEASASVTTRLKSKTYQLQQMDSESAHVESTFRELAEKKRIEAERDNEDMEEFLEKGKQTQVAAAGATKDKQSKDPQAVKRALSAVETYLIEKSARLDSSAIQLAQALDQEAPAFVHDHLDGEGKEEELSQAKADFAEKKTACEGEIASYRTKVEAWKTSYCNMKFKTALAKEGDFTVSDVETVLATIKSEYEKFFSKSGHQSEFRKQMRAWKDYCATLEKESRKFESVRGAANARKRKAVEGLDADADLSPFAKMLKRDLEAGKLPSINTTDNLGDGFDTSLYVLKDEEAGVAKEIAEQPGVMLTTKWSAKECAKEKVSEMTSTIENKKLLARISTSLTTRLSSKLKPGNLEIKFASDCKETEENIKSLQASYFTPHHYSCNVLAFALGETRLVLSGTFAIIGFPLFRLTDDHTGESIDKKKEYIQSLAPKQLFDEVREHGFQTVASVGDLIHIPGGSIIVFLNSEVASLSLRWSTYNKQADFPQVKSALEKLLHAHAYLSTTEYKIVYDSLS